MKTLKLTDDNYAGHLTRAELPLLLVFKASFCGPSASLEPLLDELYDQYAGDLILAEIDVEECPKLARELKIKGTPTLIVMNLGTALGSRIGTMTYGELAEWIESLLCKGK